MFMIGIRVLLALALALPALCADPRLLSMVPGNTEAVMGLDMRAIMRSAVAKELMSSAGAQTTKDLDELIRLTGVDPRQDIFEVVLAGFTNPAATSAAGKTNGVAMVTGNFNPERIGAAILSNGGEQLIYKGRTLWVPSVATNKDKDVLTFLDGNLLLAGNDTQVKRLLDGGSGALNAGLRSRIEDVAGRYDAWMVSSISPASMASSLDAGGASLEQAAGPLQGEMFQKIESVQGGLKFGSQVQVGLEMNAISPEDATALLNVLQFFKSMMAGSPSSGDGAMPAGLQSMLSAVQMHTQAKTLVVSMSVPENDVVQFLKTAAAQAPPKPGASSSAPPRSQPKARSQSNSQPQQEEIIIIQ